VVAPLESAKGEGSDNIYDALVVAAALEAGCATLYSEDLHDGQTIDGQLTIRNPFAKSLG
jgi:predicted nucleic acid-binding protein